MVLHLLLEGELLPKVFQLVSMDVTVAVEAEVKVKELTRKTGQKFSVVTFDQQLYNLAIQIQWDMIKGFPLNNFFIRLGGMHTLMNFVGAIGTLMSDS